MPTEPVYLDANAAEPLHPAAAEAMQAALAITGNPSSIHRAGRAARAVLEGCRERLAARFGAATEGVVFTSGGTEANALAVHGLAEGRRIILGATEHDAVRASADAARQGGALAVEIAPVGPDGQADLAALARMLAAGPPALLCLMLANNETGVIHPLAEAAALCRRHGARLHVDAVAAGRRMDVRLDVLGADSLALSSLKLGGPAGAGALLLAPDTPLAPLIAGGGQERGRRGGTPALPAIAGMAAAAEAPMADLAQLRAQVEQAAIAAGALVAGAGAPRLSNTSCLVLPGLAAQTQVIALDLAGCAVSAGAACSSGKVARSHVLAAMGLGEDAGAAIRVSLPWNATEADIAAFAAAYRAMVAQARRAA